MDGGASSFPAYAPKADGAFEALTSKFKDIKEFGYFMRTVFLFLSNNL
jgi:hypothetical protein